MSLVIVNSDPNNMKYIIILQIILTTISSYLKEPAILTICLCNFNILRAIMLHFTYLVYIVHIINFFICPCLYTTYIYCYFSTDVFFFYACCKCNWANFPIVGLKKGLSYLLSQLKNIMNFQSKSFYYLLSFNQWKDIYYLLASFISQQETPPPPPLSNTSPPRARVCVCMQFWWG